MGFGESEKGARRAASPGLYPFLGTKEQVDPVRHLIGTALGWGGNPDRDATYLNITRAKNDGSTVYKLNVNRVPVDAFVVLIFFAWSVGLLVSGFLLRYGLGAENLAWSLMFIIQPLGCIFYPVAALPDWLQPICWILPPTYVFEGLRGVLNDHVLRTDLMLMGLAIDALLFAGATFVFARLLAASRRAGTLLQTGE